MGCRTILFFTGLLAMPYASWRLTNGNFGKYSATAFCPQEIIDLVKLPEHEILGICKDKYLEKNSTGYELRTTSIKNSNGVELHESVYGHSEIGTIVDVYEKVVTWTDGANRLLYCITSTKDYNSFWHELSKIHPKLLKQGSKYFFPREDSAFLIKGCVFIKCGFDHQSNANCIGVIDSAHFFQQ